MVTFVRQNPGLFAKKPRDPPNYKEDPGWTKDLEHMEKELQELREVLVASSTRREVIASSIEKEPPASPQRGPAPHHGCLGQLRFLNHPSSTSQERALETPRHTGSGTHEKKHRPHPRLDEDVELPL